MSNETSKISELNSATRIKESALIPVVNTNTETNNIDLSTLRSALWFENAYTNIASGLAGTKKGESFFVYEDETKTTVLGYMNQGGGTYSPLLDAANVQIALPANNLMKTLSALVVGVESFDDLRKFKPLFEGQRVYLKAWNKGTGIGGGEFVGHIGGGTDDGGVTAAGTGFYWERVILSEITSDFFGLLSEGKENNDAFQRIDKWSIERNIAITIKPGFYKIKNLTIGGSYIFLPGAIITGELGETDNLLIAKSGLSIKGGHFIKTNLNWAKDGDYGNILRIGTYRQKIDGSNLVKNITVSGATFESTSTDFTSQSIEVLGKVNTVTITDSIFIGPGAGIICHWAGDVGTDGDNSQVTYSFHPHSIRLENLLFKGNDEGLSPGTCLILSACYDVLVRNIKSIGAGKTLWVTPGDVYNEVAVPEDKDKICTGILVDTVIAHSPKDGDYVIEVSGIPATKRTTSVTRYGRDTKSIMSMEFRAITIIAESETPHLNPFILIRGTKNVSFNGTKVGGDNTDHFWALLDYNDNLNVKLNGQSIKGERLRGNTDSSINLTSVAIPGTLLQTTGTGCFIETFLSSNLTSASAIKGATSLFVTKGDSDGIIFNGSYLLDGNFTPVAKVKESVLLKKGIKTEISIYPLIIDITDNTTLSSFLSHQGTVIYGRKEGFLYNYSILNGWGMTLSIESKDGFRGGVIASGDFIKSVIVKDSLFVGTGSEISVATKFDINVSTSRIEDLSILNNRFDPIFKNPTIHQRLNIDTDNHSGVTFTGNYGTGSISGVTINIKNSAVNRFCNMQQIFSNSFPENIAPVAAAVGFYQGNAFRGVVRDSKIPSAGYFTTYDKLEPGSFSKGGVSGWICLTSGNPGTWASVGTVPS